MPVVNYLYPYSEIPAYRHSLSILYPYNPCHLYYDRDLPDTFTVSYYLWFPRVRSLMVCEYDFKFRGRPLGGIYRKFTYRRGRWEEPPMSQKRDSFLDWSRGIVEMIDLHGWYYCPFNGVLHHMLPQRDWPHPDELNALCLS